MRQVVHALALLPLLAAATVPAAAQDAPTPLLARFGAGAGPTYDAAELHLLDAARTRGQVNAAAWERAATGAHESVTLRCELRVTEGGCGGGFALLATDAFGATGPAPFLADWTAPNLRGSLGVGIDTHDPPNDEPFGPLGNVNGRPEREVSLHFDGRELVKRVTASEFRGEFVACELRVVHVVGGADVTLRLGDETVYDAWFVPDLHPYELRVAAGACTSADAAGAFDVRGTRLEVGAPAAPRRPPVHVELFNHVLTDNARTAFETEASLPPLAWSFGRVVLTLEIHDAGPNWDEWDRNGEVSLWDPAGTKRGIVPFITSYRTPCRWQVDVTHFRPWLAGQVRFEVAAGTTFYKNRGYMMSVSLDFHHGSAALEPYAVLPLWNGTAHHGTPENHFADFFAPLAVAVDANAEAARVFCTTTGHSQVGEFTPSRRAVVVVPDAAAPDEGVRRFENTLWKDDCYLNPNRPQFGTWKFSRAGWAPGDVVRPWWIDLTGVLVPGRTAELRYEPQPYEFPAGEARPTDQELAAASHVVRSYLVLWRTPRDTHPAPTLEIVEVVKDGNAAGAGVRVGDWLVSYDGRRIDSQEELRAAMRAAQERGVERIPVVLARDGADVTVEVAPGRLGIGFSQR